MLFGIYFVTAVSTFTISVQAVAYLVETGFSALEAASIYGVAGVMSLGAVLFATAALRADAREQRVLARPVTQ